MIIIQNNFERIKESKDEYEMADLVMGYICNHIHEIKNEDGTINSLSFLKWLQGNQNIFGEERVTWGDIRKDFSLHYKELESLVDDYRPHDTLQIRLWLKTGKCIGYDYKTKKTFKITTNQ